MLFRSGKVVSLEARCGWKANVELNSLNCAAHVSQNGRSTMASITEGFAFCVLDEAPVLRTDSSSYRLNPSPSGQRWSRIKKKDARRASKLKSIAFFHKFGVDLPIFPPSLRPHDPRLWLITNDKYFPVEVGKSLNSRSRYAPSKVADVINLDQHRRAKSKFYLG